MPKSKFNQAILPVMFGFFIMGFVDIVGVATNYVKADFAGMDDKVLKLRSLEAFEAASNGQATKIIIPSDIQNLAGLVTSITEISKK